MSDVDQKHTHQKYINESLLKKLKRSLILHLPNQNIFFLEGLVQKYLNNNFECYKRFQLLFGADIYYLLHNQYKDPFGHKH